MLSITIWIASIRTVFNVNFPPQSFSRYWRSRPSNSRTRIFSSWFLPDHIIFGMPPATDHFVRASNVSTLDKCRKKLFLQCFNLHSPWRAVYIVASFINNEGLVVPFSWAPYMSKVTSFIFILQWEGFLILAPLIVPRAWAGGWLGAGKV